MTAPAIAQRVRRLENRGVIRQFAAGVNPGVSTPLPAYVAVSLDKPELRARLCQRVNDLEAVQECSTVAGEDEYLLKVRCASTGQLDELLGTTLLRIPGAGRIRVSVVLSTIKETPVLPVPDAD